MAQAKHTPGPWVADGVLINGPDGMIGELGFGLRGDPEMQANARLMAAAPDLLAALEATVTPLIRLGDFIGNEDAGGVSGLGAFDRCAIILKVHAAIAKAKGVE
jgi:hypothetical protein